MVNSRPGSPTMVHGVVMRSGFTGASITAHMVLLLLTVSQNCGHVCVWTRHEESLSCASPLLACIFSYHVLDVYCCCLIIFVVHLQRPCRRVFRD